MDTNCGVKNKAQGYIVDRICGIFKNFSIDRRIFFKLKLKIQFLQSSNL